jgi:hypothetical protein
MFTTHSIIFIVAPKTIGKARQVIEELEDSFYMSNLHNNFEDTRFGNKCKN